jgi:hypothetical protein
MSACTQRWLICTARGMRIVLSDCGEHGATPAAVSPLIRLALGGRAHGDKLFGRRRDGRRWFRRKCCLVAPAFMAIASPAQSPRFRDRPYGNPAPCRFRHQPPASSACVPGTRSSSVSSGGNCFRKSAPYAHRLEGLLLTQADGSDSGQAEYGRRDHRCNPPGGIAQA